MWHSIKGLFLLDPMVKSLLGSILLNRLGQFIYPFLVLILGRNGGYDASRIGMIMGLMGLAAIPMSLVGGYAVDRFGAWRVLVFSQLGSAGLYLLVAVLGLGTPGLVGIFLANGLSNVAFTAHSKLIALASSRLGNRLPISASYLAINLGYAVSALVGAQLIGLGLEFALVANSVMAVAAALVLLPVARKNLSEVPLVVAESPNGAIGRTEIGRVLAVCIVGFLAYFLLSHEAILLPTLANSVLGDASLAVFSNAMVCNTLIVVAFSVPVGVVFERTRNSNVLGLGFSLYVLAYGVIALAVVSGLWPPILFIVAVCIASFGEILVSTSTQVLLAQVGGATLLGRMLSLRTIFRSGALSTVGFAIGTVPFNSNLASTTAVILVVAALGSAVAWVMAHRLGDGGR